MLFMCTFVLVCLCIYSYLCGCLSRVDEVNWLPEITKQCHVPLLCSLLGLGMFEIKFNTIKIN